MSVATATQRLVTGQRVVRKSAVVLEIGNRWIKIGRAAGGLGKRAVVALHCEQIPDDRSQLPELLRKSFRKLHLSRKNVILQLPRHLVTARPLRIPATDADEVSHMVRLQAGRQTPYSKEEVISGHAVLESDEEGYSHVLMVIARRALILERVEAMENAGLEPAQVGVSSEGLANWCITADEELTAGPDAVAVLDVDAEASEFAVFVNGRMAFTKAILIGGDSFRDDKAKWVPELVKETQSALERFAGDEENVNVTRLVLTGLAYADGDILRVLQEGTRARVEGRDPAEKMPIRNRKRLLEKTGVRQVSLASLIGAVVTADDLQTDLMLPDQRISRTMNIRRGQLTAMGSLTIVMVMLLSCLLLLGHYRRQQMLDLLDSRLALAQPAAEQVEARRKQMLQMQKRLDARGRPVSMLAEIHEITPETIKLQGLSIDARSNASLQGRGRAMSDVIEYVDALEASGLFDNVKTTYTSQKEMEGRQFAEFQISCQYQHD